MTLGVAVALGLMVTRRLPAAGVVAIGVAAGPARHSPFILLVPLVVASWGQWRRLAILATLAPVAFAVTSPPFVVHLSSGFLETSAARCSAPRLARFRGRLADADRVRRPPLGGDGPALLVALLGLVSALVQRTHADKILAAFVLAYFRDAAAPGRPLRPLSPVLLVPGARRCRQAVRALGFRNLAGDPARLAAGSATPASWRRRMRVVAHDWMEANLTPGVLVAADPSTATPEECLGSSGLRRRAPDARPIPNGTSPGLRGMGVGYVVVTGAVADRVAAAKAHYPRTPASTNSSSNRGTGASTRRRRANWRGLG